MKKRLSAGIFLSVLLFLEGIQICFYANSTFGCIEGERQALLKLKQSFKDPSSRLVSWTGEDCCRWRGVSCHKSTRHVVKLDLRAPAYSTSYSYMESGFIGIQHYYWERLSAAEVNSCLAGLKHLEYLDLSGNDFNQSPIPEFFGSLKQLRYLNLSTAEFHGRIPHQLRNLTSLKVLDLSDQYFSSYLYADNFQWASSLFSLQHLDMSSVDLSKALDLFQVLNTLPSLVRLQLNYCGIQNIHFPRGSVNSTFLASIQFLGLRGYELRGEIPNALHNMTALRQLDLSSQDSMVLYADSLQGLSSLSSLQDLDMSGVNLSKAHDLIHVLNTLPSLLHLRLDGCGIQNVHFSHANTVNSTFFARVQYLYLSFNMLNGPLPNSLKNMTELRELDLSQNNLNSTVPLCLVNSKSLVILNIGWNQFDNIEGGLFSMLNNACSLKSLDLSFNPFRTEILESNKNSSRCLTYSLESLFLESTAVSGNIPDWLGQLQSLKNLNLRGNSISGLIPQSLGKLSALEYLDLSNNQLSGAIPQSLGKLSALVSLDLSYNQLSGAIPQSLGKLSALKYLELSYNHLNGTIPQSLGKLSTLEFLVLSHNQLSGILDHNIGQLTRLLSLDISSNPLEGVISELSFANLSQLSELSISSTNLTWKVKPNWIPPFSLYFLNMSSCKLGSQFPQWLQTQNRIVELDLSHNNISGGFPQWFNATSLRYFDLSMNQINGNFLGEILDTTPEIETLLLGNNLMRGSIPSSLCKLDYLKVLDLSSNRLSGEIPHCWRDLQQLLVINLSFNRLFGKIPNSLGKLTYLKRFHLNKNNFDGEIPQALRNCTNLELLDLGENRFFGSVPPWIGESLLSLRILRLRKNMLNGRIPPQLCQLSDLQILDLAENNLIGEIPHCFRNLSGMSIGEPVAKEDDAAEPPDDDTDWKREKVSEVTKGLDLEYTKLQLQLLDVMDLSSNRLVGVIPDELCLLSGLRGLNLSHNHLSGNIPNKIGELKLLDTLDLSNNQLVGAIPTSMSALPSISHLNLSNNKLSGRIPTSNQLQTLTDPSIYAGNLQLCGDPLPKCPGDDDSIQPPRSIVHEDRDDGDDKKEKILFWFVVTTGYATGLWAVIGTLVFKKNWRIAYFWFVDNTREWMLVMIAVKVARLKKMLQRTSTDE